MPDLARTCPSLTLQQVQRLTQCHHDDWVGHDGPSGAGRGLLLWLQQQSDEQPPGQTVLRLAGGAKANGVVDPQVGSRRRFPWGCRSLSATPHPLPSCKPQALNLPLDTPRTPHAFRDSLRYSLPLVSTALLPPPLPLSSQPQSHQSRARISCPPNSEIAAYGQLASASMLAKSLRADSSPPPPLDIL